MTAVSEADTRSFAHARPRLLRIARRVLANAADADDVVQDAWMRWQETDRDRVRDPSAFLATTTTRLALNVGQSARVRYETAAGGRPADTIDWRADPTCAAERADELERALDTLLARLTATECAVYVLREAFDYPHRRIAQLLGLSEANVRQVATRARRHLTAEPRRDVDAIARTQLLHAVLAAARTGRLAALERLLAGACGSPLIAARRTALCAS